MFGAFEDRVASPSRRTEWPSPWRKTLGALLVFSVAVFARGQDTAQAIQTGATQPPAASDDEAVHRQMEELIQSVERNLRKIDTNLYAAAAGQGLKQPVTDSGISRLLQLAQQDGSAVQRDIAKILELAASHKHPSSGGT